MRIGFDLDGIFVDKPPFIPKSVIELLYRGRDHTLTYRIPSKPEQFIRRVSHMAMFRPPIRQNIQFMKRQKHLKHTYFLISGRFGFLQKETKTILRAHAIHEMFSQVILNTDNEQPHLFKNIMIKKWNIDRFVDDDLPLLKFLAQKNPQTVFFWLHGMRKKITQKNLRTIDHLSKVFDQ